MLPQGHLKMIKLSLIALFVSIMAMLTIAASAMPVPPQIEESHPVLIVAELD
jgi:hypothetical protein